jgi:hypothetical protein
MRNTDSSNSHVIKGEEEKMMKFRVPISFTTSILSAFTYGIFAAVAYLNNPQPISPLRNWLSDLGNQITNPQGAIFYNIGVISCALFLALWFTAGLHQWKLKGHPIQHRLLLVAQAGGVLTAFALMMSALFPINHLKEHAFWSDLNFILFGISFAFTVTALRYHPKMPRILLFIGGLAAILPTMVLFINNAYWLEWVAVGLFIIYILSIGIAAYIFAIHRTNSSDAEVLVKTRTDLSG